MTPGEPQVVLGTDKAFTFDYVFDTNSDQVRRIDDDAGITDVKRFEDNTQIISSRVIERVAWPRLFIADKNFYASPPRAMCLSTDDDDLIKHRSAQQIRSLPFHKPQTIPMSTLNQDCKASATTGEVVSVEKLPEINETSSSSPVCLWLGVLEF